MSRADEMSRRDERTRAAKEMRAATVSAVNTRPTSATVCSSSMVSTSGSSGGRGASGWPIAPPRTLHRATAAMPAASWMRVSQSRVTGPEIYYRLEDEFGSPDKMDAAEAEEEKRRALGDRVVFEMHAFALLGVCASCRRPPDALPRRVAWLRMRQGSP